MICYVAYHSHSWYSFQSELIFLKRYGKNVIHLIFGLSLPKQIIIVITIPINLSLSVQEIINYASAIIFCFVHLRFLLLIVNFLYVLRKQEINKSCCTLYALKKLELNLCENVRSTGKFCQQSYFKFQLKCTCLFETCEGLTSIDVQVHLEKKWAIKLDAIFCTWLLIKFIYDNAFCTNFTKGELQMKLVEI